MLSWLTVVRELLLGLGKEKRSYKFCHNPPHLPRLKEKNGGGVQGEMFQGEKKGGNLFLPGGPFPC